MRKVVSNQSFSLSYQDPVSGIELGLNGGSVSAFSAEEVPNKDNCTPTQEDPKNSSLVLSDHDARTTSSLMKIKHKLKQNMGREGIFAGRESYGKRKGKHFKLHGRESFQVKDIVPLSVSVSVSRKFLSTC